MSSVEVTHDMIAGRAYERFAMRGYAHGGALEDWLTAEAELRAEHGVHRGGLPTGQSAASKGVAREPAVQASSDTSKSVHRPAPKSPARANKVSRRKPGT
jgi:hypothetical protein